MESDGPPVVGTFEEYARSPFEQRLKWAKEEDLGLVTGSEKDHYLVGHPEYVREVLVERSDDFEKPSREDVYGEGLLGVTGEQWRRQRSALQSAFNPIEVEPFHGVMQTVASDLVTELTEDEIIDVKDVMESVTLRVTLRVLFGKEEALETFERASEALRNWFRNSAGGDVTDEEQSAYEQGRQDLLNVIERFVTDAGEDSPRGNVLSTLVREASESVDYTDSRVRDELFNLLFVAHESSALALTYTFYLLADAPGPEEKLQAELDAVLGDHPPTGEDLPRLKYLDAVIDESLRLYTPSDAVFRKAATDTDIGGHAVPEGTIVSISQWAIHRDERWWEDPMAFRPERFDADSDRPRFAFFPFGAGPHRCVGDVLAKAEAKFVVASAFQKFTFDRVTRQFDIRSGPTAYPVGPIELAVGERT